MNLKNKILNFRFNRWALLAIFLLLIVSIQSCDPGTCLLGLIGGGIGFVLGIIIIALLVGWIPVVGPIIVIVLIGYVFYDGCINDGSLIRRDSNCGCSAFCENIKPENENK